MKRIAFAFVPALLALPAAAQPKAVADLDYCATYEFKVEGQGNTFSLCRAGTLVWSEDGNSPHRREVWDTVRAQMRTVYVKERKYTDHDYHGRDQKLIDKMRPYAVKRLVTLTDPEVYRFERIGPDKLDGRDAVKWRVTARPGKEYLAFQKRGYAWTAEGGLLLRIDGDHDGKKIELNATKLEHGTPDEDRFKVPRGYKRLD